MIDGRRPLFGTGLSRSGGGLYSNLLSANTRIEMALCPFLELFRSLRNALLRREDISFSPTAPLGDYYFDDNRINAFDAVQRGTLDLPFEEAEWPDFLETCIARGALESEYLTRGYARLKGETYREVFDKALDLIAESREAPRNAWVGFHETWVLEFFPLLARSYPDARFIVMLRDPRAIVNSIRGILDIDPLQFAHTISYARHWRKYVALALEYRRDPDLSSRIWVTSHDRLVQDPETTSRGLCEFLEVEFEATMLDTSTYIDRSTGSTWTGNSSFEPVTEGVKASRSLRWREKLDPAVVATVEFLCGPELQLCGYDLVHPDPGHNIPPEVASFLIKEGGEYTNWRTDFDDPQRDVGFEQFRRLLLHPDVRVDDPSLIRRSFLCETAYHALRGDFEAAIFSTPAALERTET